MTAFEATAEMRCAVRKHPEGYEVYAPEEAAAEYFQLIDPAIARAPHLFDPEAPRADTRTLCSALSLGEMRRILSWLYTWFIAIDNERSDLEREETDLLPRVVTQWARQAWEGINRQYQQRLQDIAERLCDDCIAYDDYEGANA